MANLVLLFIDAWNNLTAIFPRVPWWILALTAAVLCILACGIVMNWRTRLTGILRGVKVRNVFLGVGIAAGGAGAGWIIQAPIPPGKERLTYPQIPDSANREPVVTAINGFDDTLRYEQRDKDWRFQTDSGNGEVEIDDSRPEEVEKAYQHAYGLLFSEFQHSVVLPSFGFNIQNEGVTGTRIRVELGRGARKSNRWCLHAFEIASATPRKHTNLAVEQERSSTQDDCWETDKGATSAVVRTDFDGTLLRVNVEFFRDAYRPRGSSGESQTSIHSVRRTFKVPFRHATKILAALGQPDQARPPWRIGLMRYHWRAFLTKDRQ